MKYNYGKLKQKIKPENNISYYKRENNELSINVTNKCPNNCCFCIRDRKSGWSKSNLYLTKDPTLKEIILEIQRSFKINPKISKVKICGYGEPILRIEILPKIISVIKKEKSNVEIQLATSGWPLYNIKNGEYYFKESVKNGLEIIYLGLHAINFNDYKKKVNPTIPSERAFKQVINFIKLSKTLNLKVICAFVDLNDLCLKDINQFTKKLNCEYEIRKFEK